MSLLQPDTNSTPPPRPDAVPVDAAPMPPSQTLAGQGNSAPPAAQPRQQVRGTRTGRVWVGHGNKSRHKDGDYAGDNSAAASGGRARAPARLVVDGRPPVRQQVGGLVTHRPAGPGRHGRARALGPRPATPASRCGSTARSAGPPKARRAATGRIGRQRKADPLHTPGGRPAAVGVGRPDSPLVNCRAWAPRLPAGAAPWEQHARAQRPPPSRRPGAGAGMAPAAHSSSAMATSLRLVREEVATSSRNASSAVILYRSMRMPFA